MTGWRLVGAWLLTAAVATTVTWQIVSAADEQVSDRPIAALEVTTNSTVPTTGAGEVESTTSTTSGTSASDPTLGPATSTTTGSTTPSSGDAGVESGPWQVETVPTAGGTVVLGYRPGEVRLESVSPAAGFSAEVRKEGPPVAEVRFESQLAEVRVEAEWRDGALSIEIDTDAEAD